MKINYTPFVLLLILNSCSEKAGIKPERNHINAYVFAPGTLLWDNLYTITAQTDGTLQAMNVEIGDTIHANFKLSYINNESNLANATAAQKQLSIANENVGEFAPNLLEIKQQIMAAKAKFEVDSQNATRYERLYEGNHLAKSSLEQAQLLATQSKTAYLALLKKEKLLEQQANQKLIDNQNQFKISNINKAYNNVWAPMFGVIIKKLKENGDFVKKGDAIVQIANPNLKFAKLQIDESGINQIAIGQQTIIKFNTDKNKLYEGTVRKIWPAFDEASQSYIVEIELNNAPKLAIYGTQLEANILIGSKQNVLLIPKNYVTAANEVHLKGTAQTVKIETGIVSSSHVEVVSGLDENSVLLPLKP